eukprot:m.97818 g.97818  ORF g.97818 m.97818 type:complete len:511 (+) comp15544_c0_seq2:111-1643(+)
MAKRISQETFDAVVKENQAEFDMAVDDAIADAVEQFEKQGVDLSNILRENVKISDSLTALAAAASGGDGSGSSSTATPSGKVLAGVQQLETVLAAEPLDRAAAQSVANELEMLLSTDDLALRLLAGSKGLFPLLMRLVHVSGGSSEEEVALCTQTLATMAALLNGQPDLVTPPPAVASAEIVPEAGFHPDVHAVCTVVRANIDRAELVIAGLRCVRHACVKHELNRQTFMANDVVTMLKNAITSHSAHSGVVSLSSQCIRTLVLDDDVRVPFGKAHDHAKAMVNDHGALDILMKTLKSDMKDDAAATTELCLTISRLTIRDEFCKLLVQLDGLETILQTLKLHSSNPNVVQACFSLLKAMSGNDDVKDAVNRMNGFPVVIGLMNDHIKNPSVAEQGCATLAALALRKPANCTQMVAEGVPALLSKVLAVHAAKPKIAHQVCMAIRNLVARTPELRDAFLQEGVEALINQAMSQHQECQDSGKGALRDLGCKVELRELWKGKSTKQVISEE